MWGLGFWTGLGELHGLIYWKNYIIWIQEHFNKKKYCYSMKLKQSTVHSMELSFYTIKQ